MNIFQKITGRTGGALSPEMQLALRDKTKANKMLVDLQLRTEMLTKKDIGTWRAAWQQAINVQNPNRSRLYDVYTDVEIDLHVTGCISQRKGMVKKRNFKLVDKAGIENKTVSDLFKAEWFDLFVDHVLDSRYYGHSLIQFGAPVTVGGTMRFDSVELVPRRHVIPEYGVVVRHPNDIHQNGISYRTGELADWCIEAGQPHDLGLLLKCAPAALSKKNMLAFWDGFGEIFGMPIRIAKTTSRDESERSRIEQMLARMGAAFYGLFSEGTDIEIKESSRGDAYNVYDRRVDRCNSEISKGLLNQTMTIDSGSSLSQSQVHLEVFQNVVDADANLLRNTINDRLLPLMTKHGFPVEGCSFEWNDTVEYTPQEQINIEQMLVNGGYDIDPKYFAEKYGIPVLGKKNPLDAALKNENDFFV
ncbi:MAG: DUF935 family protein [Paludibacteraceae bacterium]